MFARTTEGELGILPGHTPLLGALAPGWVVRIERDDEPELRVAVHGGFLSVRHGRGLGARRDGRDGRRHRRRRGPATRSTRAEPNDGPDGAAARDRALARLRGRAGETV